MLQGAYFTGVFIWDGHFECAFLLWARFQQCQLIGTHFEGVDCNLATFEQVQAPGAHFEGASIGSMRTAQVDFFESYFEGAGFGNARLQGARFVGARFHGAHLDHARLEGAVLDGAHLEGKELSAEELARLRAIKPNFPAVLPPADLRGAVLNSETSLVGSIVGDEKCGGVFLADARLSDTNLAVVDWTYTRNRLLRRRVEPIQLGDVREAHKATNQQDKPKSAEDWITGYMTAVRANRQLATALRSQGLNEDADNFAYEAQRLQREVLRRQRRYGAFLWSSLLDLISGYGYKPLRSVGTYLFIILFFMFVYSLFGVVDASCVVSGVASNGTLLATCSPAHTLTLREAFVFSSTSFHGRGFFPGGLGLGSPITLVAAAEAVIGLLIEITFIATFTQRFFAR